MDGISVGGAVAPRRGEERETGILLARDCSGDGENGSYDKRGGALRSVPVGGDYLAPADRSKARQVGPLIVFLTKCTLPSPNRELTPPGW